MAIISSGRGHQDIMPDSIVKFSDAPTIVREADITNS